jgi:hypothetical protein
MPLPVPRPQFSSASGCVGLDDNSDTDDVAAAATGTPLCEASDVCDSGDFVDGNDSVVKCHLGKLWEGWSE